MEDIIMDDKKMNMVCRTCFFGNNFPGVAIEENGSCNYCNSTEFSKKIRELTTSNLDQLRFVASQLREERVRKGGKYDCIIGASGGFDSSYVVYVAKRIMELNPLVVCYTNDFAKGLAKDNLKRLCDELNVDLKIARSKKKFDKKHVRAFMQAFKDVGSYWGCCEFCVYVLEAVIYKFASEENISTMLVSNNIYEGMATQYLTKEFKRGFMLSNISKLKLIKLLKILYYMVISQYYFIRFKMEFFAPSRIKTFFHRSTVLSLARANTSILKNITRVNITQYIPWDIDKIIKTLETEVGWKSPEKPYLPMRFDCVLEDALIDRTYKNATGVTLHTIMCNNLIYGGARTKKDLEATVYKYEKEVAEENIQLLKELKIK
jgi:hypothetical protein